MRATFRGRVLCILIGLLLWCTSGAVQAQSLWFDRIQGEAVVVYEMLKPDFASDDRASWATSTHFLSVRLPSTARMLFTFGLAYSRWGYDDGIEDFSETALGNLFVASNCWNETHISFGKLEYTYPVWRTVKTT